MRVLNSAKIFDSDDSVPSSLIFQLKAFQVVLVLQGAIGFTNEINSLIVKLRFLYQYFVRLMF